MVDFGNSVFEGKLDPSVPLLNPVDDRSAETFAGALANGIDRFNKTVFSADAKASKADAAKNSYFAEYADKVGLIADARDQGMGSDEALRNIRVAQNQFVSNHPELVDDFFTFSNKLMTENGFGGNIIKETPQESGERKMIEAGVQEGWDMNNPESVAAYKEQLNNKIYIQQVENKIKMLNLNGDLISASVKAEAINGLHSLVATGTQWVMDQINGAYTKLEGVTDPILRQAIIDEVKAKVATQSAVIGQKRTQTGNAVDTSYMTSGIDTLVTNFENVATGKTTLDAVKTSNETIQAKNQALVMITNPKLAQLIALDGMSKFQLPGMMKELDSEMLTTYGLLNSQVTVNDDGTLTSDNKPPDVVDKVDNVAKVFDMLKQETTNLVKDGGADKEAVASQANKIVNIMRSTVKYGANDSDAKNFTAVVDFFADPTVGKFMETNASTMYPQVAAEARYVIEQQYDSVVIPLINERWTTATDQIKTSGKAGFAESLGLVGNQQPGTETITDASKVVEPYWNGVGIEMRPAKGFETNPQVREIVKGLNQGPDSITGPLNKLIRAKAHLSGTTDYEKVYNEGYKDKLWITTGDTPVDRPKEKSKVGPVTMTDDPSTLDIADFGDNVIKDAIAKTNAKDPEAMLNASSSMEVAQAYLGMNENNPEQAKTLSAFIARSTGQNINPATTAWCAAFVDAVLGGKGTGKLNARSYLSWGVPVTEPKVGDVVVLQRSDGGKNDWQGHVGFYMGETPDGKIKVLGGNQGDSVSEDDFDPNKVLGFRRAG